MLEQGCSDVAVDCSHQCLHQERHESSFLAETVLSRWGFCSCRCSPKVRRARSFAFVRILFRLLLTAWLELLAGDAHLLIFYFCFVWTKTPLIPPVLHDDVVFIFYNVTRTTLLNLQRAKAVWSYIFKRFWRRQQASSQQRFWKQSLPPRLPFAAIVAGHIARRVAAMPVWPRHTTMPSAVRGLAIFRLRLRQSVGFISGGGEAVRWVIICVL